MRPRRSARLDLVWGWISGGCLAAGAMGLIALRWEFALLALPAFAIEVARDRRGRS